VAGGGPGPGKKPSIDPEILRSLDAARRGSASHETRLLEPRSPSRLGLEDEAPGEDRGRGSGRTTGKQKAAGGPAKRSRSRRGAPRAPREDVPAMETMAPEPAPAPADVSAPVEALEPAAGPASLETASLEVPPPGVPASDEATPHPVRARIVALGRAGVSRIRARFRSGRVSILDHRVELKVSTIAAMALAGAILCVLVVTWLRLPPEEDAMLASFLPEPAPAAPGTEAAGGTGAGGSEAERGPGDSLRSLPLWSPSSAPPGESPRPPAAEPGPEIRNVEVVPAADADIELEAAPGGKEPAGGEEDADPTAPGPAVHMIQVRAKESMEGARRILDYLAIFGFEKSQIERDPRGAKNWEGKPLYTVFVGAYHDRAEADRECGRLKRVTRDRPFRNREDFSDFFESALVITRTRR
jgi:hypothetical protein